MADKYRPSIVFIGSLALFVALLYPSFRLINQGILVQAIFAQSLLGALLAISHAMSPMTISRLFPSSIRVSGLGLGFNIMVAIFAGSAPIISMYMIRLTGDKLIPAYYIAAASIIAIAGFIWMQQDKTFEANL